MGIGSGGGGGERAGRAGEVEGRGVVWGCCYWRLDGVSWGSIHPRWLNWLDSLPPHQHYRNYVYDDPFWLKVSFIELIILALPPQSTIYHNIQPRSALNYSPEIKSETSVKWNVRPIPSRLEMSSKPVRNQLMLMKALFFPNNLIDSRISNKPSIDSAW